jgi:hypothetical protein
MSKPKKKFFTNKEIVAEYFRFVKSKDIKGLKDLFWSDAIVFEPFSKLEEGLRGWSKIEPFLKVAIVANESLSYRIGFESGDKEKEEEDNNNKDIQNHEKNNKNNNNEVVEALVTFQKDEVVKAKFRFELSSAVNAATSNDQSLKKIKSLHIEFI